MRSTSSKRVGAPASERTGRTAAYRLRRCRSCTLTEVKPSPTGVVQGPLSATPWCSMASVVDSGSTSGPPSSAATPALRSTHSMGAAAASRMRRTAAVISGPIPSPGMSTAECFFMGVDLLSWSPPVRRGTRAESLQYSRKKPLRGAFRGLAHGGFRAPARASDMKGFAFSAPFWQRTIASDAHVRGIRDTRYPLRECHDPLPRRRPGRPAVAVARIPANACPMAPAGAAADGCVYAGHPRPPRLRSESGARARSGAHQLLQTRDGQRHGPRHVGGRA